MNEPNIRVSVDKIDTPLDQSLFGTHSRSIAFTAHGLSWLQKVEAKIDDFLENYSIPEWIDLQQAIEMKGLMKSVVRKQYQYLWPPLSEAREIGGRKVWHKSVIQKWIKLGDNGNEYRPCG
jgi:hypothetical protein